MLVVSINGYETDEGGRWTVTIVVAGGSWTDRLGRYS